tara:strand:- start:77 stop:523 length:447 start_codon:yes stop_codon:yes gene_type:complete
VLYKFITRIWGLILLRINQVAIKKIFIGIFALLVGLYIFQDWEGYFLQIIESSEDNDLISENLNKLFYIKITKYIYLSLVVGWIVYSLLSLSLSKKSVTKKSEEELIKKQEEAQQSVSDSEEYLDQLEDVDLYPDLQTKTDKILKDKD